MTFDSAARGGGDQLGITETAVATAELAARIDAAARGTAGAALEMWAAADSGAADTEAFTGDTPAPVTSAATAEVVPVVGAAGWLGDRRFDAFSVMAKGSWLAVRLPAYASLRAPAWVARPIGLALLVFSATTPLAEAAVLMAFGLFRIAGPARMVAGFCGELMPKPPVSAECGEADCEVSA